MNEGAPKFEGPKKRKGEVAYYEPERDPKTNEIKRMKAYDAEGNELPESPSRRKFLKGAAGVAGEVVTGAATGSVLYGLMKGGEKETQPKKEGLTPRPPQIDTEAKAEKDPTGKDIAEQLEAFGEVVDMDAAVAAVYENEYSRLAETEDGQARVRGIVARYRKYDIDVEPYLKEGLEGWLRFGLPGHESDWLSRTSPSGAIGTHQFMPATIKSMGYTIADALNPEKANVMTAEYLADERRRFGDDLYMLLHAYNAGAGLAGFTKEETDQSKWTRKNLYAFIAKQLNETYRNLKDEGFTFSEKPAFTEYKIMKGDTLWDISKEYGIDMDLICKENGIEDPEVIHAGETLRIPYKNNLEKELRAQHAKIFQMLEYAPKVVAMQDAAASLGYVAAREKKDDSLEVASSK